MLDSIQNESSILIENLWDAPKAAIIAFLLKTDHVLLITAEIKENRVLDNLAYFGITSFLDFPASDDFQSPDLLGKRYEVLFNLQHAKQPTLIHAPLQACLQSTPSTSLCMTWKRGDEIAFSKLAEQLSSLGYRKSSVASDKGEFAIRGGILDIFPTSSVEPYRIEFFGDTIEQIRSYDPIGQKSVAKLDSIFISPAQEIEKKNHFIFDDLKENTWIIFDDLLALEDRFVQLQKKQFPKLRFKKMYFSEQRVEELSEVQMSKKVGRAFYTGKEPLQPLSFHWLNEEINTKRYLHPFQEISSAFSTSENKEVDILEGISHYQGEIRFVCANSAEENALKQKLHEIPKKAIFERGYLASGFFLNGTAVVPMTELTHRYKVRRQKWRTTYHTPPSDFHELIPGDIVVHFQNGIAQYLGIEKQPNHLGILSEFLVLEYADNGKLYVPVSQSHLVSKYIGAKEEIPTLHTLGTTRWQKTKAHAQKAIIGYAQELLKRSAERELTGGFIFPEDSEEMRSFEEEFPYVETEDQLQAIYEIKHEMMSSKAMDRLLCGDVGYGKTEVAMRAAFKAVVDGKKQVAILVPTTVLALQHQETFAARMASFPINIASLSRFSTPKENRETLKKVAAGSIDILIGTHRMISRDVHFKDLGLLIIDEEQRFGVRAKEHLKAFKAGVDCLTLSATPIPRTLYLSLLGAKEISVINTPPQDRLPIKTILTKRGAEVIQEALTRELSRDGQAFFIHNRVESIFEVTSEIQKLLPQARIVTGHGQMAPDEIDAVFHAFKNGHADILVSTTIIENGIDIPNANTILIDRADQFGLADLYQLRGRVGRWNRPAYAYFLTPHKELPELSRKRLMALLSTSGYGGGMKIAMRDLEIRGAGNILGEEQSGQIATIGFHLYCKLLKRTIDAMKKNIPAHFTETKMEFTYDARLPDEYINEPSLRHEIYHRLGDATALEEVDQLLSELKDRFGPPPPPVIWLYHLTRLRVLAALHQISSIKFNTHTLSINQKTYPMPRFKTPADLEKAVTNLILS